MTHSGSGAALEAMIEALKQPRASSRLADLGLMYHCRSEADHEGVKARLLHGLLSGAWPCMMGNEPLQLWEVRKDRKLYTVLGQEVYGREYRQGRGVRMFGPEVVRRAKEDEEGGEVGVGKGQEEEKVVVRCHGWWRWWLRWARW